MELTPTMISIQDVLRNAVKASGDFTKIKHKGGNEMKMSPIIKDLETLLTSKKYLKNYKMQRTFYTQILDVTFFLIINTEFQTNSFSTNDNYAHLTVCPKLSKCLLANIITELDLVECFCDVVQKLPAEVACESFHEMIPCMKKTSESNLEYTFMCVKNIIMKVNTLDTSTFKNREYADNLVDIASEMVSVLSKIATDQLQGWTKRKIYLYMGYSFLKLLLLLELCTTENELLIRLISTLDRTACDILRAVTITVFCTWAEITIDGEILQTVIQAQAYNVKQKYEGFEPAKDLVQMLSSVAKKPKTLSELIREADIDIMVANINKADMNQTKWFTALLNTQVFNESKAINCLEKWSHLCTVEDASRVLNLGVQITNNEIRDIIVKCVKHLTCEEIILVATRFYSQSHFNSNFETKQMQNKLKLILNQISEEQDYLKELLIICLQNPSYVLAQIYSECVKNAVYSNCMKTFFTETKYLFEIDGLASKTLKNIINSTPPNAENIGNYKELIIVLVITKVFNCEKLLFQLFKPILIEIYQKECYETLKYTLTLTNSIFQLCFTNINYTSNDTIEFIELYLNILDSCRVNFFKFTNLKKDINEEVVTFLNTYINLYCKSYCDVNPPVNFNPKHFLNKYYSSCIMDKMELSYFETVLPNFNIENYTECVTKFIKILPACVTQEWMTLVSHLEQNIGAVKSTELLTDGIILLCQLAGSQENSNEKKFAFAALKHCLQHYGIAIKDIFILKCDGQEHEINIIKQICRLIREIPKNIKEEEGLKLVTLFPDESLKSLKLDKPFVLSLMAIDNTKISQLIANKMLA